MPSVKDSIIVKATPEKVFELITDFERYPKIFPDDVLAARLKKRSATSAEVAFIMNLVTKVNLELKFNFKEKDRISWTLIKGDHIKKNSGHWEIISLAKNKTEVVYATEAEFGWLVPKSVATMLIESHLPKMLERFKKAVEK